MHILLIKLILVQHELLITNKKKIELLKAIYAEKDLREKVKRLVFE